MMQIGLIALAAGASSALLFTSLASGSLVAVLLCFLAPLPIFIAALGWTHWAGLAAGLVGTFAIWLALGFFSALAFLTGVAASGWWLGYLAMLARTVDTPAGPQMEWYPPGSLIFWAAVLSLLIGATTWLSIDLNQERLTEALRPMFQQFTRGDTAQAERLTTVFLAAAPSLAASTTTVTTAISLWLAGHVAIVSGRLRRPWPDLTQLKMPPRAFPLLLVGLGGWLLPAGAASLAGALAAAMLLAYAFVGFAVMHALTRGVAGRFLILGVAYLAVLMQGWPVLVVSLIGLLDMLFDFRARFGARGSPPNLPKPNS